MTKAGEKIIESMDDHLEFRPIVQWRFRYGPCDPGWFDGEPPAILMQVEGEAAVVVRTLYEPITTPPSA